MYIFYFKRKLTKIFGHVVAYITAKGKNQLSPSTMAATNSNHQDLFIVLRALLNRYSPKYDPHFCSHLHQNSLKVPFS